MPRGGSDAAAVDLSRRQDAWRRFLIRAAVLAAFLVAWELAGDDSLALLFPTFTRTVAAFWDLVSDGTLPLALFITNQTLIVGFGLAILLGVPAGIFSAKFRVVDRIV